MTTIPLISLELFKEYDMNITCPYYEFLECSDTVLCMLYNKFKVDGLHWANYPDCNKENCPLLHPELLGNMIWEDE